MTSQQAAALRQVPHLRVLGQLEHGRMLVQGASGAYVLSRGGLLSRFKGTPNPRPQRGKAHDRRGPCD